MNRPRRLPQRTCVACRQVRAKSDLVRVVRTPTGKVEVDEAGKAPGRGAYVCRSAKCARNAVTQQKLSRALGLAIGEDMLERLGRLISFDVDVPDVKEGCADN
ncbi:MAG: YlxR family protein [Armatimonadetes bacterium]|nr:YlxR family protein [Armatimonadota bacterium]